MTTTPEPDVAGTVFEEGAAEIARSYALALLNVTDDRGESEAVLGELDELVEDVWRGQNEFAFLLGGGIVDPERRDRVLTEVFEGRAHPTVVQFLRVLGRRDRLELVPLVARIARSIWDERNNRVPVTVRSAVPLDDGQREQLRGRLEGLTGGATPILSEEVDASLIGGLVVRVGDQVYDASIRRRLEQIREDLMRRRTGELRRREDLVTD